MVARCTLDDFIRNNKHQVRVSPYSKTVTFAGSAYRVPPGMLFDLLALEGKGLLLESPSVKDGADISLGVGLAFIVDDRGKRTGYHLGSYGGQNADRTGQYFGYYISDDQELLGDEGERFRRMTDPKRQELRRRIPLPYL